MRARPRLQKSLRASAQNRLLIPADRRRPNFDSETQSPTRTHSPSRSAAPARSTRVFEAKTPVKVAEAAGPFFLHCEKLRSHAEKLLAVPLGRVAWVFPFLLRPSPRGFVNPAVTTSPAWSEMKTVGAVLCRT